MWQSELQFSLWKIPERSVNPSVLSKVSQMSRIDKMYICLYKNIYYIL